MSLVDRALKPYPPAGVELVDTSDAGSGVTLPGGLSIWARYKAESMSGISDGATASQWDDISGNARHATQSNASFRPTKRNGVAGSMAAFDFTPGLSWMDIPDMSGLGAGELFLYGKMDADPAADGHCCLLHTGSHASSEAHPYTDGVVYDGYGATARKTVGNPGDPMDSWFLMNVTSELFNYNFRLNGASIFSTATNTGGYTTTPWIGQGNFGGFLKGRIAEIILLDTVVGSSDRTATEAYFASEYGGGGGSTPSGMVNISWANRDRTIRAIRKQSDPTETLESGQTTTIDIYGQDGTTLLRTETGLTGTDYDYLAVDELADTGLTVLQTSLTFKIRSERDGYESLNVVQTVTR